MVTYFGYVETVLDALLILEACRVGKLSRERRRPTGKEQSNVQSGAVYVWDEEETGIRRWTDGRRWSSSRPRGNFIIYRELRDSSISDDYDPDMRNTTNPSTTPSPTSYEPSTVLGESPDMPDRSLSVLTSSGHRLPTKPNGLTKRGLSVKIADGRRFHLVSYYSAYDVISNLLKIPRFDPFLRNISIPKALYPELTCDVGHSGQKTWRFAMAQGRGRAEAVTGSYLQPPVMPHQIETNYPVQHDDHRDIDARDTSLYSADTIPPSASVDRLLANPTTTRVRPIHSPPTRGSSDVQLPPMSNLLTLERNRVLPVGGDTPLPRRPTASSRISTAQTSFLPPLPVTTPVLLYQPHTHHHHHHHYYHHSLPASSMQTSPPSQPNPLPTGAYEATRQQHTHGGIPNMGAATHMHVPQLPTIKTEVVDSASTGWEERNRGTEASSGHHHRHPSQRHQTHRGWAHSASQGDLQYIVHRTNTDQQPPVRDYRHYSGSSSASFPSSTDPSEVSSYSHYETLYEEPTEGGNTYPDRHPAYQQRRPGRPGY